MEKFAKKRIFILKDIHFQRFRDFLIMFGILGFIFEEKKAKIVGSS